jgi:hypothetical protein
MSAAHVIGRAAGITLLVCGAHFLVRKLTGKTPLEHLLGWLEPSGARRERSRVAAKRAASRVARRAPAAASLQAASAPFTPPLPPTDPIDESSWESFPASDPPARSPKNY